MKPGRDNYEIWVTDWLDGKLTAGEEALLLAFLEANPDIKQEAEELKDLQLIVTRGSGFDSSSLKKSAGELSTSQVELLSVAYLENDISAEQRSDLNKCLSENPEAKTVFEKIQKTKLTAPSLVYSQKKSLKKFVITPAKIVRVSATVISAAAVVALFIVLNNPQETAVTNPDFIASAPVTVPPVVNTNGTQVTPVVQPENIQEKTTLPVTSNTEISNTEVEPVTSEIVAEIITPINTLPPVMPVNAPDFGSIAFNIEPRQLSAITMETLPILAYDDGSNRIERFVRRIFREEILKDEANTSEPLKAYEVAEAGIEGINRLFGWEMTLVKNNDEAGELKSLYFSSSLIKFNAPVKKSESAL